MNVYWQFTGNVYVTISLKTVPLMNWSYMADNISGYILRSFSLEHFP